MEIIPAILPKDFNEIEEKTILIRGLAKIVQVDICDGKYVTSTTWPYKKADKNFEDILHEDRGMPNWEDIEYEFDLMIKDPTEHDVRQWLSAGATRIVLHAGSSNDLLPVMAVLNGLVEIGLALNIQTPLDVIEKYKDKISYVQFMGITRVGYQAQAFDPKVLEKIKECKEKYPNLLVQVDGGVSIATSELLAEAGADRLVTGSALFSSDNIVDTYRKMGQI
jgi:ribulose-phosphate 3-epimerase